MGRSNLRRPELSRYRWQKIRARIKARDGHRCVRCGSTSKLSVHHIVPARLGGGDEDANLVTLCSRCHHALEPNGRRKREPVPVRPWSRAW